MAKALPPPWDKPRPSLSLQPRGTSCRCSTVKRPLILILILILVGLLTLAWRDTLPGGWALHGWIEGEEGRAAWARGLHSGERLEFFEEEQDEVPAGAILFLGSSTVERIDLDQLFPDKACVNRGVNGDTTEDLITRLHISLPRAEPGGIFIAIGGNDLRRERLAPATIRDSMSRLLTELELRLPEVPRTVMGLFPTRATTPESREKLETLNLALSRLCAKRKTTFLGTDQKPLRDPSGALALEFSADTSHLNVRGYRQLAEWIIARGGTVGTLLAP